MASAVRASFDVCDCFSPAGVCVPGTSHREDVRLQEAGEEEDKEEEGRVHGAQREADSGEGQQQVCGKSRVHVCARRGSQRDAER